MPQVRFRGWLCNVEAAEYAEGRGVALLLNDAADGGRIATASVNIPSAGLPAGYILIKDWSENEGILGVLQEHGIVGATEWHSPTGRVQASACKLFLEPVTGELFTAEEWEEYYVNVTL